jgi:hypothetical protein
MPKTSKRPMIKIHNAETDEVIEREMNDEEFAQYEIDNAEQIAYETAKAQEAADKAALLARLGFTEDELKTILG